MITVRCDSCGFVLYNGSIRPAGGRQPGPTPSLKRIKAMWGGQCPKCMSPLEDRAISYRILRV